MRNSRATLPKSSPIPVRQTTLVLLSVLIGFAVPLATSGQTLRGTTFVTESGDHTVEWNENWVADLTSEDEFSTMVMLEGQIMIYAVMFIHDENIGLSERAVYHSLSGVLVNSFDSPPIRSIEWEGDDGAYRGAHLLQLSGIDFVLYLRVDPAAPGTGPTMQFAAAPQRAFPVSLEAMQAELLVDSVPVFDGDLGDEVVARIAEDTTLADASMESDASDSQPAPGTPSRSSGSARPIDDRSRSQRDALMPAGQSTDSVYVSNTNDFTVSYPNSWSDMSRSNTIIGEFSLSSESGRSVVSFTGRSTTETNRQAFFEDIAARESRYPGFVDSVISEDRLLIATWTADNELAVLEYVFVNETTVVTIMVTITSANPDRYVADVKQIELNDEPILRDWEDIWPED
jgi:hypothetical protein